VAEAAGTIKASKLADGTSVEAEAVLVRLLLCLGMMRAEPMWKGAAGGDVV